jgi:hypothetical protein
MKRNLKYFSTIIFSIFLAACSKLNDELAPAPEVNIHGEGVYNSSSPDYHGKLVLDSPDGMEDCKKCHASDYSGGITGIGCTNFGCHPTINVHIDGILDPSSNNFHGSIIKGIMWDMRNCRSCHANDYSGGIASPSCLQCHSYQDGPEACNTCHGNFNNIDRIAPPRDLNKDTLTTSPGVGAHVIHLYDNDLGAEIPCVTCHIVPQNVYDQGHVDTDPPAEIIFGEVAIVNNGINSTYDYGQVNCSSTYCHGNFVYTKESAPDSLKFAYIEDQIVGSNASVIWNQVDGTQAECGSCHGTPPVGHLQVSPNSCGLGGVCHVGIVDANGNIIDKNKHINGEKNVAGN